MRLRQLEYVTAVARFGSFRRAAEELHISQPALSETVRNLEREFGVSILDRHRSGATLSEAGRELLPYLLDVIEAVDRLKRAAGDQHKSSRIVRLGTVSAATAPILTMAMRSFRESHPKTQVEVVTAQQRDVQRALLDGSLDLGLVNYLSGDEISNEFTSTELLRGRPVVAIHPDDPLTASSRITADQLAAHPLVMMRAGYAMHRYLTTLLGEREPTFSYSTDGAEMGKLMVAEGLGAAVLPDYSVIGDPLETRGAIEYREIDDDTEIHLVLQRRRGASPGAAARDLNTIFKQKANEYAKTNNLEQPGIELSTRSK
mgnify:CR=1 FL=1